MQQHAVPQNISSFEFKLVGFLTIKQFGYLAVAGVFSFIIFITPINFLLRILVILPFAGLGLALAFIPINGLPFDKWLVVFTRSIYSPSRRVWHKTPKEISFLSPWFASYLKRPPQPKPATASGDRTRLDSYIGQLRSAKKSSHLDDFEARKISNLNFSATVPHIKPLDLEEEQPGQAPQERKDVELGAPQGEKNKAKSVEEDPPWLK